MAGNKEQNHGKRPEPGVPDNAIVKPEEEHPIKTELRPEEVPSKDEIDYEAMTTVEFDEDGDGNPDYDPAA